MKSRKNKRLNITLFILAALVFAAMIIYSNTLVKNIEKEERQKVSVWADAITYKANLVLYMDDFFKTIRVAESKRATMLVKAMQKFADSPLYEDPTFYLDIISANSTIPAIITDANGKINFTVNVDTPITNMKHINELGNNKLEFDSLKMVYDKNDYVILYYKESKIYSDLRLVIENLVNSFFQEVVINDASIPVIITNSTMCDVIDYGMINPKDIQTTEAKQKLIKHFLSQNKPIKIELPHWGTCYVLYKESKILMQLRYYPIIQLIIIIVFIIAGYLILSFARRSEQNRVWVGMSKETAHQLGTPISSLLAWNELLREQGVDSNIMHEIEKDVNRLETIAQRFSKIGSEPELVKENIATIIEEFVDYLQSRISSKVVIKVNHNDVKDFIMPVNRYLFEWVIENLCKNSVDAMDGKGVIIIDLLEDEKHFFVDITDTGKGISSKGFKQIFQPGFTTKKRGWGLGLTLAKRIIKQYHKGKLFVKSSVIDRGTVMRIQLNKA